MKHSKLLDADIVAAMLLAYVPGLARDVLPEVAPAARMLPAGSAEVTEENPADRL